MPSLANLQPTTELQAVNGLLSAIGEAPIPNISTAARNDVTMAVNILRATSTEIQKQGWLFNTEEGLELVPDGTYSWGPDTVGDTTVLNVWEVPSSLARWSLTDTWKQNDLKIIARPAKKYGGAANPLVFYDALLNRDGLKQADYPSLYINAVWLFDFTKLPQSARDYIVRLSARRFVEEIVGSAQLSQFTTDDLLRARRDLLQDQGNDGSVNMFDNPGTSELFGGRFVPTNWPQENTDSPTFI